MSTLWYTNIAIEITMFNGMLKYDELTAELTWVIEYTCDEIRRKQWVYPANITSRHATTI